MSEHDHPLDELLQAYLDGEATAEERVQVETALVSDPGLAARRRTIEALTARLSAPLTPPPPAVVDDHIRRALTATVVDLDAARRRRRPLVLGAAAAVTAAFLIGTLMALDGDDNELADAPDAVAATDGSAPDAGTIEAETAGPAVATDAAAGPGIAGATAGDAAAGDTSSTTAPTPTIAAESGAEPLTPLPDEVAAIVAGLEPALPGEERITSAGLDPACTEVTEAAVGPAESAGTGAVAGMDVVVVVGAERVAVVASGCAITVYALPPS